MKLIKISATEAINPDCISAMETKNLRGKEILTVWVEGRSYKIDIPIKEFLDALDNSSVFSNQQHFAG